MYDEISMNGNRHESFALVPESGEGSVIRQSFLYTLTLLLNHKNGIMTLIADKMATVSLQVLRIPRL